MARDSLSNVRASIAGFDAVRCRSDGPRARSRALSGGWGVTAKAHGEHRNCYAVLDRVKRTFLFSLRTNAPLTHSLSTSGRTLRAVSREARISANNQTPVVPRYRAQRASRQTERTPRTTESQP